MNEEFRKKHKLGILPDEVDLGIESHRKPATAHDEYIPHPLSRKSMADQIPYPNKGFSKQRKKARQRDKPRSTLRVNRRALLIGSVGLCILAGSVGGLLLVKAQEKPPAATGPFVQPSEDETSLPIYFPRNLPKGYTYKNDAKSIKKDVYYFGVEGPEKAMLYVTQQTIPEKFDFTAFNKKFLQPNKFDTSAGTAIAGQVGTSFIGSIITKKNTWVLINSATPNSQDQVEIVARSLEL